MGKAERQGYTYWENAEKAGVVGTDILWSDDEVYRDCTIGQIRKTIGSAFPIDLAVAFTLGSIGRNDGLTVKDMVNEHTRRATLLMSGKVGYGMLPAPEEEDCGHDKISATQYSFPRLDIDALPRIKFLNTKHTLKEQFSNATIHDSGEIFFKDVPEEVLALTSFRTNDVEYMEDPNNPYYLLGMDVFTPLREYLIECGFTTQKLRKDGEQYVCLKREMISHHTLGECAWADDNEKNCSYHNPQLQEDWWMIQADNNSLHTIWFTGKDCVVESGWNAAQFNNTKNPRIQEMYSGSSWNKKCEVPKDKVLRFNTLARNMINLQDDKDVIKQIRKALARMKNWAGRDLLNYDLNGRNKRGNHTLYTWSNWTWLENIHTLAKYTNSKNRAVGDRVCTKCYAAGHVDEKGNGTCLSTCNEGWMYEKFNVQKYFGHEIAKFRWIPIMGNGKDIDHESPTHGRTVKSPHVFCFETWPRLDSIFRTQQEATLSRKLMTGSINRMNGMRINSDWDEATNSRLAVTEGDMEEGGLGFSLVIPIDTRWVTLPAEIHPEEFSTAYDLYMGALCGSPDFFDEFKEYLIEHFWVYNAKKSAYDTKVRIVAPKIISAPEEEEEEEAIEVTIDEQ